MADVKDIYVQIYEILLKETEEDTNEWRDIWCLLIGRLNIIFSFFCSFQFLIWTQWVQFKILADLCVRG